MTLTDRIVLEVDIQDENDQTRTGVFELQEDLNITGNIPREYLMGPRGTVLRQIVNIGNDLLPEDLADNFPDDIPNRQGFAVDGGGGEYTQSITGNAGPTEDPWGDGSANTGEYNQYDASGDVPLVAKKQVLEWYLARAESDSQGRTRLHYGLWTDGSYSGSAGVFGQPLPVFIPEATVTDDPDDPSVIEVSLECSWAALFPGHVVEAAENVQDEAAELIPDY